MLTDTASTACLRHRAVRHALLPLAAVVGLLMRVREASFAMQTSCTTCEIGLTRIGDLGSKHDSSRYARPSPIIQDSRGRFYLIDRIQSAQVFAYDSALRFLGTVGGSTPLEGELTHWSTIAIDKGDNLHTFSRFHSVFSPDRHLLRSDSLPEEVTVNSAVLLADGRIVAQAMVRTPDRAGFPLQLLSPSSKLVSSFGWLDTAPYVTGTSDLRVIALARDGHSVWTAPVNAYRFERWSIDGKRLAALEARSTWFEPWTEYDGDLELNRPPARVQAIREDALGRLWVLTLVASSTWMPAKSPIQTRVESQRRSLQQLVSLTDTMLEVIDGKTGRILASKRLRGLYEGFVGADIVAQVGEPTQGFVSVTLWHVDLRERGK